MINNDKIEQAVFERVNKRFKQAGITRFRHQWKQKNTSLKNILIAVLTDHLFNENKNLIDLHEVKQQYNFKHENNLTMQQYLVSLFYFYGIEQNQIDEFEHEGIIGFRKKNKTKKILFRYREKIHSRALHIEKMNKNNAQFNEAYKHAELLWKQMN